MRRWTPVVALVLVLAACGGDTTAPTETAPRQTSQSATSASDSTTASANSTVTEGATNAAPETTATASPQPEGPPAPDFTMALADGSSFTLSEAQHPVFMVFWAEW